MVTRGKAEETDYAYAAGIIDGEGSISIRRVRPSGASKTHSYTATVDVGSTCSELIAWLLDTFGGSVYAQKPTQPHYKPVRRWNLSADAALRFCYMILPYLKIKPNQAALLIEFQNNRKSGFRSRRRVDPLELAWRDLMWQRMQVENGHPQRLSETAPDAGEAIV